MSTHSLMLLSYIIGISFMDGKYFKLLASLLSNCLSSKLPVLHSIFLSIQKHPSSVNLVIFMYKTTFLTLLI